MKKITFTISKDGKVKADAEGFVGGACVQATDNILSKLSSDKKDIVVEHKQEFFNDTYETETNHNS